MARRCAFAEHAPCTVVGRRAAALEPHQTCSEEPAAASRRSRAPDKEPTVRFAPRTRSQPSESRPRRGFGSRQQFEQLQAAPEAAGRTIAGAGAAAAAATLLVAATAAAAAATASRGSCRTGGLLALTAFHGRWLWSLSRLPVVQPGSGSRRGSACSYIYENIDPASTLFARTTGRRAVTQALHLSFKPPPPPPGGSSLPPPPHPPPPLSLLSVPPPPSPPLSESKR